MSALLVSIEQKTFYRFITSYKNKTLSVLSIHLFFLDRQSFVIFPLGHKPSPFCPATALFNLLMAIKNKVLSYFIVHNSLERIVELNRAKG